MVIGRQYWNEELGRRRFRRRFPAIVELITPISALGEIEEEEEEEAIHATVRGGEKGKREGEEERGLHRPWNPLWKPSKS